MSLNDNFAPDLIRKFMRVNGVDPSEREGLKDTPTRVAAAWEFWLSGYKQDAQEVLKTFEDGAAGYDEMVTQLSVPYWSMCEHHMAPFFGLAHVGYIPRGKIVGLSKIGRLIEVFARRLQVQERLTNQVADALVEGLTPLGVGVLVMGRHSCMESRGIRTAGTVTVTSALRGVFKQPEVRAEFYSLVQSVGVPKL